MSALSVSSPFPIFTDIDGEPLEDGNIYIGEANQNPEVVPITTYWDSALTVPAAQPIRTIGGYPSRSGTVARIYVASGDYSITVRNKKSTLIYASPGKTEVSNALESIANVASLIGYTTAVDNTSVNVLGYSTPNDGGGGIFNYDSSKVGTNNGGTIINGWVRQYNGATNLDFFGTHTSDNIKTALGLGATIITSDSTITLNSSDVVSIIGNLNNLDLSSGIEVILNIPTGTFEFSEPVIIRGSNLSGLKLIGLTPEQVSIASQISVAGSVGAYIPRLSVTNSTSAIGDFLHTTDTVGTDSSEIHRGIWEIVDRDSTLLKVNNTAWTSSFPINTITSSVSYILKTILKFNSCDGFIFYDASLGLMDNMAVVGNSDDYWSSGDVSGTELGTHGLLVAAPSVAVNGKADNENKYGISTASVGLGNKFGVSGFDQQGIVTENSGSVWGDFVSSCNNKRRGFYASTGSGIRAKHISANGNYINGCIVDIGGALYSSSNSCACGNGSDGVVSFHNGALIFENGFVKDNVASGVVARYGGFVHAVGAAIENNAVYGVDATVGGTAYVNNSTIKGNTSKAIAVETGAVVRASSVEIDGSTTAIQAASNSIVYADGANVISGAISIIDSYAYIGTEIYGSSNNIYKSRFVDNTTQNGFELASSSLGDMVLRFDPSASGTFTDRLIFRSGGDTFYAHSDNTMDVGRAANRFRTVYAGTGTINTSDEREKQQQELLTTAEQAVAIKLKSSIKTFKFNDAVEAKGESSRIHVGVMAQEVITIFSSEGLDATKYALLCYDEWEEESNEDGNVITEAGNRYGIRYEELLAFIISAI